MPEVPLHATCTGACPFMPEPSFAPLQITKKHDYNYLQFYLFSSHSSKVRSHPITHPFDGFSMPRLTHARQPIRSPLIGTRSLQRPSSTNFHVSPFFYRKPSRPFFRINNISLLNFSVSHTRSRPSNHHTHTHTFIMPRQRSSGRAGPARAPARPTAPAPAAPQQQRPAATMAAPPPQAHAPPAAASQGPGLFGQMASTAAYVALFPLCFHILFSEANNLQRCRSRLLHRPRHRRHVRRRLLCTG